MNSDTYSALIFALLAASAGAVYFNRSLREAGFSARVRTAVIAAGTAVIAGCLLYYLGLI